jgi:hypothetical protein
MLELYWAEAWELEPPNEGVGYGDLEANMAISGVGRPGCVYRSVWRVVVAAQRQESLFPSRLGLIYACWGPRRMDYGSVDGWRGLTAGVVRVAANVERCNRGCGTGRGRCSYSVQRTAC